MSGTFPTKDEKMAKKIDSSFSMNKIVEVFGQSNQYRMKVDTKLTQPEYCLFADETGCNTSMKNDGCVAGTKHITLYWTHWQQRISIKYGRFTVLPFITANGLPAY